MKAGERSLAVDAVTDTGCAVILLCFLFIAVPRWRKALTRPCRGIGKRTHKRVHRVCPAIVWRQARRSTSTAAARICLDLSLALVSLGGIPHAAIAAGIQTFRMYSANRARWKPFVRRCLIGASWRLCKVIVAIRVWTWRLRDFYRGASIPGKAMFERVGATFATVAARFDPLLLIAAWHACHGPSLTAAAAQR